MIRANELNENMKHKHADHIAAGHNIGSHKFLKRLNAVLPAGKNLICSSHELFMVDKVGSMNRITSDRLNQTWAAIKAIK